MEKTIWGTINYGAMRPPGRFFFIEQINEGRYISIWNWRELPLPMSTTVAVWKIKWKNKNG